MHFFLFFLLIVIITLSVAEEDLVNYDIFLPENLEDPSAALVPDFDPASDIAWDILNEEQSQQDKNASLDLSLQLDEDQTNFDLFAAAGCPTTDRLATRDGKTLICPPNQDELKTPEFPTFDQLWNNIDQPDSSPSTDQKQQEVPWNQGVPEPGSGKDGYCPRTQPYHLCCICDGHFTFTFCQDCLPVIPGYCDAPYIEVCCRKYGITVLKPETGVTNLEQWITIWGIENFNFDYKYKNGFIATLCEDDIHDDE